MLLLAKLVRSGSVDGWLLADSQRQSVFQEWVKRSLHEEVTPADWPHNWLRALLLLAFVVVAIGYTLAIPPGEGVDEAAHLDYVRYVMEEGALPEQPMTREQGVEVWMGHHPPLYYALGALVISWTNTADFEQVFRPNPHFVWRENDGRNGWNVMLHFGQDRFPWRGSVLALQIMRLFGVLLAAIALFAIYQAAELLFPEHPWVALGATAVAVFNPSFIYMSSTVHHDVLQASIFALAAWWIIRFLKKPERPYDPLLAGLLVAAAMLTKLSGLTLALVMGLALFTQALRERDWRSFIRRTAIVYGVAALLAGWWYVRNLLLYDDFLGWRMFLSIHSDPVRTTPYSWGIFVDEFLGQVSRTYWGGFGFMHITFPETTRYLWWLVGLALVGLMLALARRQLSLRQHWAEGLVILALPVLLFISIVRFSFATVGAGHGRYFFPAAFSVGVLVVIGLNGFGGWRYQRLISIALAVGLMAYAIWLPVAFVLPKYTTPPTASDEQLAGATPVDARLANGVQLVAYEMGIERAVSGQSLLVTLYWQATGDPEKRQDPAVRLGLTDGQGAALAEFTDWPVPGLPPAVWSAGESYVTRASLWIPPGQMPDRLYLTVEPLFNSAGGESKDQAGDRRILLNQVITTGATSLVNPEEVPNARDEVLDGRIVLSGFDLTPDPLAPGDILLVTLYWHVLEEPPEDYTTFVHLLDDRGWLVAQFDRPAGGNAMPASTWKVGQIVRDIYPLVIPHDASPGDYSLRVGMYTWPALERLPVGLDGKPAGDSIALGEVQITH